MKIKKRYFGLIGLLILALILYSIDIGKVVDVLVKINPMLFAAGLILEMSSVLIKGYKYKAVVKAHGTDMPLLESTKYFLIGFFLSLITPGRIGELARALYANQRINSIGKSLSTVIIDRLFDVGILIAMGVTAAIFFSFTLQTEVIPLGVLATIAIIFVIGIYAVSRKNFVSIFLKPVFRTLVPEKFKQKARTSFQDFYASAGQAVKNRKDLAIAGFTGIAGWLVVGVSIYLYLLALNIVVPFYFVFLLVPLITLVEMLPISFSGLGTREAAAIFLLGIYGITAAEAVAFSALVFVVGYGLNAVIGFALFTQESSKVDLGFAQ